MIFERHTQRHRPPFQWWPSVVARWRADVIHAVPHIPPNPLAMSLAQNGPYTGVAGVRVKLLWQVYARVADSFSSGCQKQTGSECFRHISAASLLIQ